MNDYSETDYEAVAKSLDGEDVTLTDKQMALASDIRTDESAIAGLLDAPATPSATRRAQNRAMAAYGSHMWKHVRIAFYSGVCAAASIVLLLGVMRMTLPAQMSPLDQVAQYYWNTWTSQEADEVDYMTLDDLESISVNANGNSNSNGDTEAYEVWIQWLQGSTDRPTEANDLDLDMLLDDLQES